VFRVFLPRSWVFSFVLVVLSGCSTSEIDRLKLVPVSGRVLVKDAPVSIGTLSFRPDAKKGNNSKYEPAANIDPEGKFQLKTAGRDGAPPGWYRVILSCAEPIDPKNPYAPPKYLVNPKYATLETTDLVVEIVDAAEPRSYDLIVQR
jgi:hypothetical protein